MPDSLTDAMNRKPYNVRLTDSALTFCVGAFSSLARRGKARAPGRFFRTDSRLAFVVGRDGPC